MFTIGEELNSMMKAKGDLDDVAESIVGCFPTLDLLERRGSASLWPSRQ